MKRFLLIAALGCTVVLSGVSGMGFSQQPKSTTTALGFRVIENPSPEYLEWIYKNTRSNSGARSARIQQEIQTLMRLQEGPCVGRIIWAGLATATDGCYEIVVVEKVCADGTRFQQVMIGPSNPELCNVQ